MAVSKRKQAVDARRKEVFLTYTLDVELADDVQLAADVFGSNDIALVKEEVKPTLRRGGKYSLWLRLLWGPDLPGSFAAFCWPGRAISR